MKESLSVWNGGHRQEDEAGKIPGRDVLASIPFTNKTLLKEEVEFDFQRSKKIQQVYAMINDTILPKKTVEKSP